MVHQPSGRGVQQRGDAGGVVLVIGQDRKLVQGQRVVRCLLRDVGGNLGGAARGFNLGGAAANCPADRRAGHFRVEQRGHGAGFPRLR